MNLLRAYADAWRLLRLRYYELALAQLTRKNACHPDVPYLVHMVNYLKEK